MNAGTGKIGGASSRDEIGFPDSDTKLRASTFNPNFPIQENSVVEFNGTGATGTNTSVIYQYGHSEAAAFYSVSKRANENYDAYHTSGFNLSLPLEYFSYWNLTYVNYFNRSSVINHDMDENYVAENNTQIPLVISDEVDKANKSSVMEVSSGFINATAIKLHFSSVTLGSAEKILVYNASFDTAEGPDFEITSTGWTGWINTSRAYIVLNGTSDTSALNPTNYEVDFANVTGTAFFHQGTDQLQIQVNPEIIGFNVSLAELNLPDNARFIISTPEGENLTELWHYESMPQWNNWTYVNNNETWGPDRWIVPDYAILKMYCQPGDEDLCNLTIRKIEYNTTHGWQRYNVPQDNYGDVYGNFIEYVPFMQNVSVNFTRLLGYSGNPASWDAGKMQETYSSWTFVFAKRAVDIDLNLYELDSVGGKTIVTEPLYMWAGLGYNFSFDFTDAFTSTPLETYNFDGESNTVYLDIFQGDTLLYSTNKTPLLSGNVEIEIPTNWGYDQGVHAGDIQVRVEVDGINHCLVDNTTTVAIWRIYCWEQPNITLNKIAAEYPYREWDSTTREMNITAGTEFDPNWVTFNLSAYNIHEETGPLNGQPFNVTVTYQNVVVNTTEIYQNYHPSDGDNYTLYTHSFDKVGNWSVTFTLKNSSYDFPLFYYNKTSPITINVSVLPRDYYLDIFTGPAGLQPGQLSELWCYVADTEEIERGTGVHFPLPRWRVDFWFIGKLDGLKYEKYFLGTAYANNSGYARWAFTPPDVLAGENIYIYLESTTPDDRLIQYAPNATLFRSGFDVDKFEPTINVSFSQEVYYFDEPLKYDLWLWDEIGQEVIEKTIQYNITVYSGLITFGVYTTGVNDKGITYDFTPYVGEVQLQALYLGSSSYYPAYFTKNVTYKQVPTYLEVEVDPTQYHYLPGETIPISIDILDERNNSAFVDGGSLDIQIFDEYDTLVWSKTIVLDGVSYSTLVIQEWTAAQNGLYSVNVTYNGGIWHVNSELNQTVLVDRAAVRVDMEDVSTIAGHDLVVEADVSYNHNGSAVEGVFIVVEFVDQMGNNYLLGFNTTDARGHLYFAYPVTGELYEYMAEFGGQLVVTSKMDLQRASGFDTQEDFQITKSPSMIRIDIDPATGDNVRVTLVLDTYGNIIPGSEELYIEIWARDGSDYQTFEKILPEDSGTIIFNHRCIKNQYYNIRVIYKGSHLIEPAASIEIFDPDTGLVSSPSSNPNNAGSQIGVTINPGNPVLNTFLQLLVILIPLAIAIPTLARVKGKARKRVLGGLVIALIAISGIYYTTSLNSSIPYTKERIESINMGSLSNFGWFQNENLPKDDLIAYSELLGIGPTLADQENPELAEALSFLNDMGSGEMSPLMAQGGVDESTIGAFGTVPYPMGDTMNVSFKVKEASNYFIVVTDINLDRRVDSIFGSAQADVETNIYIPIDESTFDVGGQYALELYVYKIGELDYQTRDSRRMTFNVIRGFTTLEVDYPNVEVYEDRDFTITLTEEYSGKPLATQDLYVMVWDPDEEDYAFHSRVTTSTDGRVTLPLPVNSRQGDVPMQVIYNGDANHYGIQNLTSYTVNPVTTAINLMNSSAIYTDNGQMSATLTTQYGERLAGKNIIFSVHLVNTTMGEYELVEVDDAWHDLGNYTTDANGVATLNYQCIYPEGQYEVIAEFNGDDIYGSTYTRREALEVHKESLEVTFIDTELFHGHQGLITANLTDNDGNRTSYSHVTFSAYIDHEWVDLGSVITGGEGLAALEYTPYFDSGAYPLRLFKPDDDRYASQVEYGKLTIHKTNSSLDVELGTGGYLEEMTLSARLTYDNGTRIDPIAGESILFYMEIDLMGSFQEFTYIGFGVTDAEGIARCVWKPQDRLPGVYQVKAFFPGNGYAEPIWVIEDGAEITKGLLKVEGQAPSQVPVMDYADFIFNLTRVSDGHAVYGETLNVSVYNRTDPTDIVTQAEVITDTEGLAFFRWVPGNPGNYTFQADIVSDYYQGGSFKSDITVTRKGVNFNTTVSGTDFYRGDEFKVTGNTTIIYKYYDGTQTHLAATGVPLRFYIWNETQFIHPISGFTVPNMPLKNTAGNYVTYSDDDPNAGRFDFTFTMPDDYYGLQAGHYYLKIRVDTTLTGLYEGETIIGFHLIEHTSMDAWVQESDNVTDARDRGDIPNEQKYFVEEEETVNIQLQDQDGNGIQAWHYYGATNRDLLINIGSDKTLYFHLDQYDFPTIYYYKKGIGNDVSQMENLTVQLEPTYDPESGLYSFTYQPYNPGKGDLSVSYSGDRFYDQNSALEVATIYRRPTEFTTFVSHVEDLFREGTPLDYVQKYTEISSHITDILNGSVVANKEVRYWLNGRVMTTENYNLSSSTTDGGGETFTRWWIPDWVHAGDYNFRVEVSETRIWQQHFSDRENRVLEDDPYVLEIWETVNINLENTHTDGEIEYSTLWRASFRDQDGDLIKDAFFSLMIWGEKVTQSKSVGAGGTYASNGKATHGSIEFDVDRAGSDWAHGDYYVYVDYVGDDRNFLPNSTVGKAGIYISGRGGGIDSILMHDDDRSPNIYACPYTVYGNGDSDEVFYNIDEARKDLKLSENPMVNTMDGYGFVAAKQAYYAWVKNFEALRYYPYYQANMPAIIAFGNQENAEKFIEDNSDAQAHLVGWEMVWSLQTVESFPTSSAPQAIYTPPKEESLGSILGFESNNAQESGEGTTDGESEELDAETLADLQLLSSVLPEPAGLTSGNDKDSSVAKGFASFFGSCVETSEYYRVRPLYVLLFKLMEYGLSGGKTWEPGPDLYYFTRGPDDIDDLTEKFEDTGLEVTTQTAVINALTAGISSSVKYDGSYSLKIDASAAGTVSSGDQVSFPTTVSDKRSDARKITLWMRYSSSDATDKDNGIVLKLIDKEGRWQEALIKPDLTYDTWCQVEIPMSNFTGEGKFNEVNEIVFETVTDGLLSTASASLAIDLMEWNSLGFTVEKESTGGKWVKQDLGDWFVENFIIYFLVKPVFEAFIYAFSRIPNLIWLRDFFTWAFFMEIIRNVIGVKGGDKTPQEALFSIFMITIRRIGVIIGKKVSGLYGMRDQTSDNRRQLDPDNTAEARNWYTPGNLKRLLLFLVTATFQGIFFAVPTYGYDLDYTWDYIFNQNGNNILKFVFKGFGAIPLGVEVGYFMLTMVLCLIDFIGKKTGGLVKYVVRGIVAFGFSAAEVYLNRLYQKKVGAYGSTADNALRKFVPEKLVTQGLSFFIVFFFAELIIDALLARVRSPFKWLIQAIVSLLLKVILIGLFYPQEAGIIPLKVLMLVGLSTIIQALLLPWLTEMVDDFIVDFENPFAASPALKWRNFKSGSK